MKILLIFEKKYQEKIFMNMDSFLNILNDKKPTIILTKMLTDYKFKYPKYKYNEYPITQKIEYKNTFSYEKVKDNYNRLIIATDFDYVGHFSAYKILSNKLGENWKEKFKEIIVINTSSFSKEYFEKYNKDIKENIKFFNQNISYGKIKYYFDYNYNLNSQVFFKEILNKKDISKKNITITKYMLLTLWQISENNFEKETDILMYMIDYKGSGKYPKFPIGTSASISTIIKNLMDLELIKDAKITKKGKLFLDSLVKQTFDPDLPMRIKKWGEDINPGVFEKINNYLLNIFTKQKNKNKSL